MSSQRPILLEAGFRLVKSGSICVLLASCAASTLSKSSMQLPSTCPSAPFETDAAKIVASATPYASVDAMGSSTVPVEYERTRNGALGSEGGGLGSGDGTSMSRWWGFDEDRGLFFRANILSWGREQQPEAPPTWLSEKKDSKAIRTIRRGGGNVAVVTAIIATSQQIAKFHCLANALLAVPPENSDSHFLLLASDGYSSGLGLKRDGQRMPVNESWEAKQIEKRISELIYEALEGTSPSDLDGGS